jgi:hypothetical protein
MGVFLENAYQRSSNQSSNQADVEAWQKESSHNRAVRIPLQQQGHLR